MEIKALQKRIETITEPRRVSHGNIRHRLDDIIIIGLCTIICLGEDYNDMEAFDVEREEWLRTFLEFFSDRAAGEIAPGTDNLSARVMLYIAENYLAFRPGLDELRIAAESLDLHPLEQNAVVVAEPEESR